MGGTLDDIIGWFTGSSATKKADEAANQISLNNKAISDEQARAIVEAARMQNSTSTEARMFLESALGKALAAQADAFTKTQGFNQQVFDAQQKAAKDALDFQKVVAFFQAQGMNNASAQQIANSLMGQQNAVNSFTQLYNQDRTNALPKQAAGLAALQALSPLMQLSGLKGYKLPTTLDTTPLKAPDLANQFQQLTKQFGGTSDQGIDINALMNALNNPSQFFNGTPAPVQETLPPAPVQPVTPPPAVPVAPTMLPRAQWYSKYFRNEPGIQPQGFPAGTTPTLADRPDALEMELRKNGMTDANSKQFLDLYRSYLQPQYAAAASAPGWASDAPAATQTAVSPEGLVIPKRMDYQTMIQKAGDPAPAATMTPGAVMGADGLPMMPAPPAAETPSLASLFTLTEDTNTPGARIEDTPIYQWKLQQAQRALNNQLAARGLAGGGVSTKANTDLALQLGGEEAELQRKRLADIVNLGMGMPIDTSGQQAANSLGNLFAQGASNTGAALQNAAQNRSGLFSNLGSAYGQNAQNQAAATATFGQNSAQNYGNYGQNIAQNALSMGQAGADWAKGIGQNTANMFLSKAGNLANFYNANNAGLQNVLNTASSQTPGWLTIADLAMKAYGMGAFGGGDSGASYGYFGAPGTWSSGTSGGANSPISQGYKNYAFNLKPYSNYGF